MNRRNNQYLYKNNKDTIKTYQKLFKTQGLPYQVKNDYDYLRFEMILTSYQNMKALQTHYFQTKETLNDLWNHLDYQEKKFLLYKDLDEMNKELPFFKVDNNKYYIAYFDDLINAYYDHEILIFETSNYRHLFNNFSDIIVPVEKYKTEPIKADFTSFVLLAENDQGYVFYAPTIKRFYHSNGDNFGMHIDVYPSEVKRIGELFLTEDYNDLIDYLIDKCLLNKSMMKRFKKMRDKS